MKIGMNLCLWTANPDFKKHESLVRKIKNWGFDGIELVISPDDEMDCKKFGKKEVNQQFQKMFSIQLLNIL